MEGEGGNGACRAAGKPTGEVEHVSAAAQGVFHGAPKSGGVLNDIPPMLGHQSATGSATGLFIK